MNQQDKELLLKDLCARLPYGVIMQMNNHNYLPAKLKSIDIDKELLEIGTIHDVFLDACKPYLRPMSSMTEEEIDTMWDISENNAGAEGSSKITDLLNKWNLDHHHLIEKGLAIEAPEGMYKKI